MIKLCMIDSGGRPQAEPLVHMQDERGLRFLISQGYRTAECWAQLQRMHERERIVRAMLANKGEGE